MTMLRTQTKRMISLRAHRRRNSVRKLQLEFLVVSDFAEPISRLIDELKHLPASDRKRRRAASICFVPRPEHAGTADAFAKPRQTF